MATETHKPRRRTTPFVISDHPPIESIKTVFKDDSLLTNVLSDDAKRKTTLTALSEFVDRDVRGIGEEVTAGEIYYHFLKLPLTTQQAFTKALAEAQGHKAPSYEPNKTGRTSTGRKQLGEAMYCRYAAMLQPIKRNKDTLAGKRVSDAISAYKVKAGITSARPKTPAVKVGGIPLATFKRAFSVVYMAAATDEEVELLHALFARAGIPEEDLVKWEETADAHLASSQPTEVAVSAVS